MKLPDLIIKALSSGDLVDPATPGQIARYINRVHRRLRDKPGFQQASVSAMLCKMRRHGQVVRVGRGLYTLKGAKP